MNIKYDMVLRKRMCKTLVSVCAINLLAACSVAMAASVPDYPNKPLRIILPTAAGGSLDTIARVVSQNLADEVGQQVVIDNRPGAGGMLGTETAAHSAPDGYTLLIASTGNIATTPGLYKKLPYDPVRDFAGVILMAETPYVMVVHPSLPVKTAGELIQYAKTRPGQLNFSSSGNGSSPHLGGELFKAMAGINIVHVPYKGSPAALNSVVSGETLIEFSGIPSTYPQIKSNRLRALGVASMKRSAFAPELPTINESGLPGFAVSSWAGMLAPTGTPRPIVVKLNESVTRIIAKPEARQRLLGQGFEILGSTPEQFTSYLKAETAKWTKVIRTAGVQVD